MKVYLHGNKATSYTLIVTPGKFHPENTNWHDDKKRAIPMSIKFEAGVADVDSQLGKFLIDQRLVHKSPQLIERL